MSHPARMGALSRTAAALVALTLTGAPRVLAQHAPVEGHRCTCRAHAGAGDHHRECECAICRKAALSAAASDEGQPSCHRAAARGAPSRAGRSGSRGAAPCVEGTCGSGARPPVTVASVEPFCVPTGGALTVALAGEAGAALPAPPHERSPDPETPPPRAA